MVFEGEYLENKKNGESKEYNYDNDFLRFKGEYLYGHLLNTTLCDNFSKKIYTLKNGKGRIIEYDNSGKILFEGEYFNGERNGKGKEYDEDNGELIFEGEYLYGQRKGKGILLW